MAFNCNTNNVIYVAQCIVCNKLPGEYKEDTYFGQSVMKLRERMNGHRGCFKIDENGTFEKSALSLHCYQYHQDKFDLKYFNIAVVKQCNPNDLDKEEDMFIAKYRTNICGINRMKVVR